MRCLLYIFCWKHIGRKCIGLLLEFIYRLAKGSNVKPTPMRVFLLVPRGWVWVFVADISTSKGTSAHQVLNLPLEIPLSHLGVCQRQLEMTRLITESSFNCTVCRDDLQLNSTVGNKPPNILREHPGLAPTAPQKEHTVFINCWKTKIFKAVDAFQY